MEKNTKSNFFTVLRWILFAPALIIQAGAFLEAEYITWVTGLILCAFLTIHQDVVKKYIRIPYAIILILVVAIFLTGSYIDMKS